MKKRTHFYNLKIFFISFGQFLLKKIDLSSINKSKLGFPKYILSYLTPQFFNCLRVSGLIFSQPVLSHLYNVPCT